MYVKVQLLKETLLQHVCEHTYVHVYAAGVPTHMYMQQVYLHVCICSINYVNCIIYTLPHGDCQLWVATCSPAV